MRVGQTLRLLVAMSIAISTHIACGSPTAPAPVGYAGEWTGTTQHGTPVRLTVSAADEVTLVILTYKLSDTCAGTLTYTDLAVPIRKLEPPGPPPFDQPGFAFGRTSDDGESATAINGVFSADRKSVSGQFVLVGYSACGPVMERWDARRR